MTTIDRQKYVAELGKLLSGMARADREAVLRGVNARFDEAGDDDAVIAALGSPTFAAVSVLRGYTPPEDTDGGEYYEEEYQYAEPVSEEAAAPAEAQPEATAEAGAAGPEADAAVPEDAAFAPETEPDEPEASVPEQVLPEPQEDVPGGDEESEAEPEAPESAPEQDNAGEQPAVPEDAASPEEPETQAADVNAAPEAEAGPVDEPAPGQVPPEARPEPLDEAAAEAEEAEPEASGPRFETVDIGLGTIEVYSDSEPEPETPDYAAEPVPDEPEADADEDAVAAPEPEAYAGPEEEPIDDTGPDGGYVPEPEYDYPDYPEPEPEKPKMRGGRVFLSVLLGIIVGIPVAAVLIVFSLALLALGAALIYVGGVFISFAFLGMSVVADILLTVGFGLFVAAIGLPVVFLAVWFFLRCVVGLYSRLFARAGAWCRGEVREQ